MLPGKMSQTDTKQKYLLQGLLGNLQLNLTDLSTHVAESWEVQSPIKSQDYFFEQRPVNLLCDSSDQPETLELLARKWVSKSNTHEIPEIRTINTSLNLIHNFENQEKQPTWCDW